MKKIMIFLLTSALLLLFIIPGYAAPTVSYEPGDVNGDGAVDNRDITRIMKYLAGLIPQDQVTSAYDVNGDGEVNNADLTRLMRMLAGITHDFKVGVYTPDSHYYDVRDEFRIHEINGNKLEFSVEWYRRDSIDHATATIDGNVAMFDYAIMNGRYTAKGYLIASGNFISLVVTESQLITPGFSAVGTYRYEYFGTEDEYTTAYYKATILPSSPNNYWARNATENITNSLYKDMLLQFNKDGTMIYMTGYFLGGTTYYQEYSGNYKIDLNTIYINGDAYKIAYLYRAGGANLTLKALGHYDIDFSGDYTEIVW